MSTRSVFKRLRTLSALRIGEEDLRELLTEGDHAQDALRVIRGCGLVEDGLQMCLEGSLGDMSADRTARVFGDRGPLGTFSDRILMARAMELITEDEYDRLTALRHLRNAFAHARNDLTFEEPTVAEVVKMFSFLPDHAGFERLAFSMTCGLMAVRLGSSDPAEPLRLIREIGAEYGIDVEPSPSPHKQQ